jgi:hypothetical protein
LSAIAGRKALAKAEAISTPAKALRTDLTVIKGMKGINKSVIPDTALPWSGIHMIVSCKGGIIHRDQADIFFGLMH